MGRGADRGWVHVPHAQLRRQMATGAGASNAGTSATRGSVPDSDDIDTEWDMDKARGLRPTPSGGGSAFDPDKAPPPESLDPDYGRRAEQLGGAGEARVRRRAAGLSEQQAARAEATGKKGGSAPHRCDWDTVFIVALACVLFSFLILDVYAQIVSCRRRHRRRRPLSLPAGLRTSRALASAPLLANHSLLFCPVLLCPVPAQKMHNDKQEVHEDHDEL
jgi:hypothetical protein